MVDIARNFIRSERTGDSMLNLQCMNVMLPYLAASGHNLYIKSLLVYLQKMAKLVLMRSLKTTGGMTRGRGDD